MINQLAKEALTGDFGFTVLYNTVENQFKAIVNSYLLKNNLTGFNFDTADYISAVGQAMWESLAGFDVTKGDFMPRVVLFARNRMKGITDFNLASKRFDKSKQSISYDELFESEEFDLEDKDAEMNSTETLVSDFIKADKVLNVKLFDVSFVKIFNPVLNIHPLIVQSY